MISFLPVARIVALLSVTCLASAALGREAIEDALGGPIVECSGAIAWVDSDSSTTNVEPMRLAARDAETSDRFALYLSHEDFGPESIWKCDGACTNTRTLRSSVTVNALRLHHETDLGSGEAVYEMNAVYVVVNARETPVQVAQVSGTGSFICEKSLPQSLTSNAE